MIWEKIDKFTHVVTELVDDNWIIQPDKFTDNMSIDAAKEHVNGMAYALAEMVGNRGTVYSHDPKDHMRLPNLKYYAYHYYRALKLFKPLYMKHILSGKKKYTVSCLNNNPRNHRILMYLMMDRPDNQLWTMHNENEYDTKIDNQEIQIPDNIQNKWNQIKDQFADKVNYENGEECESNIHEAYTNSYINIVTETLMLPGVFITEKTWKPISIGQLFVIQGSPGTIKHLRTLGIDCYDDIIDHTYDDIEDPVLRTQAIQDSIKKLLGVDLTDLNTHTVERRINNAKKFWSGKLYTKYE